MVPLVGVRNLVRRLKQVVLPAPFGPISAWMVPRLTERSTPLTAKKPLNSLVSPDVCKIKSSAIERSLARTVRGAHNVVIPDQSRENAPPARRPADGALA